MRSGLRSPCAAPVSPRVKPRSSPGIHQALRGKTHHLAQQIGIRALLQQRAKAHHLVGHRRVLGSGYGSATKPYRRSAMTTAMDKQPAAARLVTVAVAGHLPTAPTPP